MINEPDTRDLLTEARSVLVDALVPDLSGDQKYQALMIANALGMAIREIEQREQGEPETADRLLSAFLAERQLSDQSSQGEEALAQALRERRLEGGDPQLRAVLKEMTEARLRINNPGYVT